jgi:Flp pilus assembly secretin CpaC
MQTLITATAIALALAMPAAAQNIDVVNGSVKELRLPPVATLTATKGFASIFMFQDKIEGIVVGDPTVADVVALNDKTILVDAHHPGLTNLILLNHEKRPIREVAIAVTAPEGLVHIHNKKLISSYTIYQCSITGCDYTGELTVQEPAALPPGWSNSTFNNNNTGEGNPPAPVQPIPVVPSPQQQ